MHGVAGQDQAERSSAVHGGAPGRIGRQKTAAGVTGRSRGSWSLGVEVRLHRYFRKLGIFDICAICGLSHESLGAIWAATSERLRLERSAYPGVEHDLAHVVLKC